MMAETRFECYHSGTILVTPVRNHKENSAATRGWVLYLCHGKPLALHIWCSPGTLIFLQLFLLPERILCAHFSVHSQRITHVIGMAYVRYHEIVAKESWKGSICIFIVCIWR